MVDSKLFREELKNAGIKGVTVRRAHYNDFIFTVSLSESDYISFENFNCNPTWNYYSRIDFFKLDQETQNKIHQEEKRALYDEITGGGYDFTYRSNNGLTAAAAAKIDAIKAIAAKYQKSDDDPMRDYFNTNFYYSVVSK